MLKLAQRTSTSAPVVFLSHTTRDGRDFALAHRLATGLKDRGAKVWIAPESIKSGEDWEEKLTAGVMAECTHFLVILSAASIRADWVIAEVRLARERKAKDSTLRCFRSRLGSWTRTPRKDSLKRSRLSPIARTSSPSSRRWSKRWDCGLARAREVRETERAETLASFVKRVSNPAPLIAEARRGMVARLEALEDGKRQALLEYIDHPTLFAPPILSIAELERLAGDIINVCWHWPWR